MTIESREKIKYPPAFQVLDPRHKIKWKELMADCIWDEGEQNAITDHLCACYMPLSQL